MRLLKVDVSLITWLQTMQSLGRGALSLEPPKYSDDLTIAFAFTSVAVIPSSASRMDSPTSFGTIKPLWGKSMNDGGAGGIADGVILYLTGDSQVATAYQESTGRRLWKTTIGPSSGGGGTYVTNSELIVYVTKSCH